MALSSSSASSWLLTPSRPHASAAGQPIPAYSFDSMILTGAWAARAPSSPASLRSSRARQSYGACAGTDMTRPVPVPCLTNRAGRMGRPAAPVPGADAVRPTRSAPRTEPVRTTVFPRNSSLRAHSAEIIHSSASPFSAAPPPLPPPPDTDALTYSAAGSTHRFVTPKIVSGRSVATGITAPPPAPPPSSPNFTRTYSVKAGSTSPSVSCCDTGFWSLGHHPTGCEPCTTSPIPRSVPICHSTNLLYAGSIVVNSRRQSIEYPISTIPAFISSWK